MNNILIKYECTDCCHESTEIEQKPNVRFGDPVMRQCSFCKAETVQIVIDKKPIKENAA